MRANFSFSALPLSLILWIAFLALIPFYVFKSGLPRIADFVMAILILLTVCSSVLERRIRVDLVLWPLIFFVVYTFFVTALSLPFIESTGFGKILQFLFPVFYLYNFLVVVVVFDLNARFGRQFLGATFVGILLSLLLQVSLLPISLSGDTRDTLFFNNPNQLGYFILLMLSLYFYLGRIFQPAILLQAGVVLSGFLLAYLSLSKAAMISLGILLCVSLFELRAVRFRQLISVFCSGLLVILILFGTEFGIEMRNNIFEQLSAIGGDSDESFAGRGYDRITNHPEYLILGAGEGGYERFYDDNERHYELHSSYGTLVFSYGIPGTLSFALFVLLIFRRLTFVEMMYAMPVFAYGLTHMGLRFTLFWVFCAVIAVSSKEHMETKMRLVGST